MLASRQRERERERERENSQIPKGVGDIEEDTNVQGRKEKCKVPISIVGMTSAERIEIVNIKVRFVFGVHVFFLGKIT